MSKVDITRNSRKKESTSKELNSQSSFPAWLEVEHKEVHRAWVRLALNSGVPLCKTLPGRCQEGKLPMPLHFMPVISSKIIFLSELFLNTMGLWTFFSSSENKKYAFDLTVNTFFPTSTCFVSHSTLLSVLNFLWNRLKPLKVRDPSFHFQWDDNKVESTAELEQVCYQFLLTNKLFQRYLCFDPHFLFAMTVKEIKTLSTAEKAGVAKRKDENWPGKTFVIIQHLCAKTLMSRQVNHTQSFL